MNKKINFAYLLLFVPIILFFIIGNCFYGLGVNQIIINVFNHDDSFYYYKTAEIFSKTFRSSFDYQTLTNGYHPLWLFALSISYYILDLVGLISHDILIFFLIQLILSIGAFYVIFHKIFEIELSQKFILIAGFQIFILAPSLINGMETSLTVFLISLWFFYFIKKEESNIATGFIAAIVLLSRLDAVLIFLPFIIYNILFRSDRLKKSLFSIFFVFIFLILYLLLNYIYFDSFTPISGAIKEAWGQLQRNNYSFFQYFLLICKNILSNLGNILIYNFSYFGNPDFGLAYNKFVFSLSLINLFLIFALGLFSINKNGATFSLLELAVLIFGFTLFVLYHSVVGYFDKSFAWYNYFLVFLVVILFGSISLHIKSEANNLAINSWFFYIIILSSMQISVLKHLPFKYQNEYILASDKINSYIHEIKMGDPVIAGWSVGFLGYLNEKYSVINLEGLISNKDFISATHSRDIKDVVCKYNIDIIAQHFPSEVFSVNGAVGWLVKLRLDQLRSIDNALKSIWVHDFAYGRFLLFRVDRSLLHCE